MQKALEAFQASLDRVRALHGIQGSLAAQVSSALDLTDILRAEIVLAVSAFDFFVHELARLGMMECRSGKRPKTDAYKRFAMPMHVMETNTDVAVEIEIRTRHGYLSFQQPDKIADAVRLFSEVELWNKVASELGMTAKDLKSAFELVVDRRNKIAHEADVDPSYPEQLWPISRSDVDYTIDLIDRVAKAIFKVST